MSTNNGIRKITITTEALSDIVDIINSGKSRGIVDVRASVDDTCENLSIEMDYLDELLGPEIITRHMNINLGNK